MGFEEVLKVCSAGYLDQAAFDGQVSHRGFPASFDCSSVACRRGSEFSPCGAKSYTKSCTSLERWKRAAEHSAHIERALEKEYSGHIAWALNMGFYRAAINKC